MIQIISGVKGKGKTKYLIQKVNDAVKGSKGNIVYLDKNNKLAENVYIHDKNLLQSRQTYQNQLYHFPSFQLTE